jgi:hypothetical protein
VIDQLQNMGGAVQPQVDPGAAANPASAASEPDPMKGLLEAVKEDAQKK